MRLTFADPHDPAGPPRAALLMLDSGACGADLMLHARAQKELGLLQPPQQPAVAGAAAGRGGGGASQQGHYLRGVGQDPKDYVQLQVGVCVYACVCRVCVGCMFGGITRIGGRG